MAKCLPLLCEKRAVELLFRCLGIKVEGDESVENVGYPHGHGGRHVAVHRESRRDSLEQDVGEGQCQADAQVQAHASLDFAGRQGDAYQGQDERREGHGDTFVILYLELFDVGETALALAADVLVQFRTGHHLLLVLHDEEVGWFHEEGGVDAVAPGDVLFHALHLANHVILDDPVMRPGGIVGDAAGGQVGDELLVLELVQREAVTRLTVILKAVYVGYDARVYLQLDIACGVGLALLVVLVFEVDTGDASLRNDVRTQAEGDNGDDGCRHHVGPEHALEAHAGGEHGDNLRVLSQLGGEENDGYEHEQGAEQVGEVGDEVQVIVEKDGTPRCVMGHELVLLLVEVEHHGYRDDEHNGEDVSTEELLDDVSVQAAEESAGQLGEADVQPGEAYSWFLHNRVDICCTIRGFHVAKSPTMMCLRASPTSHR